jgi:hypothetical protein
MTPNREYFIGGSKVSESAYVGTVKENISDFDFIVFRAEIVNKGRHTHVINQLLGYIRPLLLASNKKKSRDVTIEELQKIAGYVMKLSHYIFLLQNKR